MRWEETVDNLVDNKMEPPLLDVADIPKIDLYMEQVTTFFNEAMGVDAGDEDLVLTKTMINNYAKAGILPPISKKRYTRAHMITLMYIVLTKQVLSIREIKQMMSLVGDPHDTDKLEQMYTIFCEITEESRKENRAFVKNQMERVRGKMQEHGLTDDNEGLMLFISLIGLEASMGKMLAAQLLSDAAEGGEKPEKKEKK
jgi:DNA-binding transcriptional MerR regulator